MTAPTPIIPSRMQRCAVLCSAVLCYAMQCSAVQCCNMLSAALCRAVLYAVMCAVPYSVLCCATVCCDVLCCATVCCAVLCCATVCCALRTALLQLGRDGCVRQSRRECPRENPSKTLRGERGRSVKRIGDELKRERMNGHDRTGWAAVKESK